MENCSFKQETFCFSFPGQLKCATRTYCTESERYELLVKKHAYIQQCNNIILVGVSVVCCRLCVGRDDWRRVGAITAIPFYNYGHLHGRCGLTFYYHFTNEEVLGMQQTVCNISLSPTPKQVIMQWGWEAHTGYQ